MRMMMLILCAGMAMAQSPGFDQLKSLVGRWEGKTRRGTSVKLSYELVSGGTALLERLTPKGEPDMITIYHADGRRVAITHYCSVNNQPRMQTEPIHGSARQFRFAFAGVTNLAGPEAGHMISLELTIPDPDHLTQQWTFREKGVANTEVFEFSRKRR